MAVHLYNKCFSKTEMFNLTYSINHSIKHNIVARKMFHSISCLRGFCQPWLDGLSQFKVINKSSLYNTCKLITQNAVDMFVQTDAGFCRTIKKTLRQNKAEAALTLPGQLGDKHLYWLASFISILMELYILTAKLWKLFAVFLRRQYGWSTLSLFQVLQPCRPLIHLRLSILFFTCTTQLKTYCL